MTFEQWRDLSLRAITTFTTDNDPIWDPHPLCLLHDRSGRNVVVDLIAFFQLGQSKELLSTVVLPLLLAKTEAQFISLTYGAWGLRMTGNPVVDSVAVNRARRTGMLVNIPHDQKTELQVALIGDGESEELWEVEVERGEYGTRCAGPWSPMDETPNVRSEHVPLRVLTNAFQSATEVPYADWMRISE